MSKAEQQRIDALVEAGFELPSSSLESLAAIARERTVDKGEYLFHKGDPSTALLVITEGTLQAVSTSYEGQDLVFGEFGPGGVIGELTVIDAAPRSASIRAVVKSALLTIGRDEFLAAARQDPELGLGLALICAKRARRLSTWAEGASFADTVGRLAAVLVELTEAAQGGDATSAESTTPALVKLKLTQQSLADQLGVTRESTNKALRSLESEGLVALGRGSVTVTDLDELQWRVPG